MELFVDISRITHTSRPRRKMRTVALDSARRKTWGRSRQIVEKGSRKFSTSEKQSKIAIFCTLSSLDRTRLRGTASHFTRGCIDEIHAKWYQIMVTAGGGRIRSLARSAPTPPSTTALTPICGQTMQRTEKRWRYVL